MKRSIIIKVSFIFGVFFLSIMMICQSVVADENENNDPTNMELLVKQVTVIFSDAGDQLLIDGENFSNGYMPEVKLGGDPIPLAVDYYTQNEIIVDCPSYTCSPGDYLLTVTTGPSVKNYDAYNLTIGTTSVLSRIYQVEEPDSARAECDDDGSVAIGGSAVCPLDHVLRRSNVVGSYGWSARCYQSGILEPPPVRPETVTVICLRP